MGRKPTCGHSFVSNPGLDVPMARSVVEKPPTLGIPRPYQDTAEVYEAYLEDIQDYNRRHRTQFEPLPNPWLNLGGDGILPTPLPPQPIVTGWETREDAFDRYLLELKAYNLKHGTTVEPVTDFWD